jgi:hypothetical protein
MSPELSTHILSFQKNQEFPPDPSESYFKRCFKIIKKDALERILLNDSKAFFN